MATDDAVKLVRTGSKIPVTTDMLNNPIGNYYQEFWKQFHESMDLEFRAKTGDVEAIAEVERRKIAKEERRAAAEAKSLAAFEATPKMTDAEIVAALAESDPRDSESGDCPLCGECVIEPWDHSPTCAYRHARYRIESR